MGGKLGLDLTEDWWEGALERVNSSCARLNLIQFKVDHTPLKLGQLSYILILIQNASAVVIYNHT